MFLAVTLGHSRWLSYLLAFPFVLLLTRLYGYALDSLAGPETLFSKTKMLFGAMIGKLICCLYALQFLLLLGMHTGFFNLVFYSKSICATYRVVLLLVLLLLVALYASFFRASRSGPLRRYFGFFYFCFCTSCDSLFLLSSMHAANLLPLAGFSWLTLWQNSAAVVALAFTDLSVLFALPLRQEERKKPGKSIFYGGLAAFVFLLFLEIRNALVLGDGIAFYTYPLLQTLSFMQIGDFLGRLEAIAMSALFCSQHL